MSTRTQPKNASRIRISLLPPNQVIPNGIITAVRFDDEFMDSIGEFNTALYRFTPKNAGYYLIISFVQFNLLPIGRVVTLFMTQLAPALVYSQESKVAAVLEAITLKCSAIVYLTPNNVIQMSAFTNNGAGATIQSGMGATSLFIHRLS